MTTDISVRTWLDPGERLIWSGKPHPVRYALRASGFTFLFGIVFATISGVGTWAALRSPASASGTPFALLPFTFVLIGSALILSPFWQFWRGTRASYLITSKRAVIDIPGPFARRTSVPLDQIRFVELRRSGSGFGSVYFKETASRAGDNTHLRRDGFIAAPEADRVEQMLRRAMEQASGPRRAVS
jgi:hypothetical protein